MIEPYATLFDGYQDHWLLGRYLTGEEPDWSGIADDPRLPSLSSGETVLVDFAAAWANTQTFLDDELRYRVVLAIVRFYMAGTVR